MISDPRTTWRFIATCALFDLAWGAIGVAVCLAAWRLLRR